MFTHMKRNKTHSVLVTAGVSNYAAPCNHIFGAPNFSYLLHFDKQRWMPQILDYNIQFSFVWRRYILNNLKLFEN